MNLEKESIFGFKKENTVETKREKIEVKELSEMDVPEIEALLYRVWSTAYEYPKEWREKRILTKEQISEEMREGYHYFGIGMGNQLAGVYKALVTDNGLFGEHQSIDPDHRALGLATAMYHQFVKFAKENNCKKVYVNILANQIPSKKHWRKWASTRKDRNTSRRRA
jgi:GNAT superfamily N-acetyltransferase